MFTCGPNRRDFSVRAGVLVANGRIVTNPDQFPTFDDHRTDWHLTCARG
jgi:hypothetical protein